MARKKGDEVYFPPKQLNLMIAALRTFVENRNLKSSEFSAEELARMEKEEEKQREEDTAREMEYESAKQRSVVRRMARHQRFLQMLGVVRSKYLGDPSATLILDGIKPDREKPEEESMKAERARIKVDTAQGKLRKLEARAAKLRAEVARREAEAKAAASRPPKTPPTE